MKSVLVVGFDPLQIDFSEKPESWKLENPDPAAMRRSLEAVVTQVQADGIYGELCLFGPGDDAAIEMVSAALAQRDWDCVLIGAGVRIPAPNFLLFERLVNLVHVECPGSTICFNTRVDDWVEAINRWI